MLACRLRPLLRLAHFNVTRWPQTKETLLAGVGGPEWDIMMVCETHMAHQAGVAAAKRLRAKGIGATFWPAHLSVRAVASAGVPVPANGLSGGVGVLWKSHLAVTRLPASGMSSRPECSWLTESSKVAKRRFRPDSRKSARTRSSRPCPATRDRRQLVLRQLRHLRVRLVL